MTDYALLNDNDKKLYAFCMGGVAAFYAERQQTRGRPLVLCHVLGGLALGFSRTPTMMFLKADQRHLYRQQLCNFARNHLSMSEREVSRPDAREMLDLAVEMFSAKPGRAKDVSFDDRIVRTPEPLECQRVLEIHGYEYGNFLDEIRARAASYKSSPVSLRK